MADTAYERFLKDPDKEEAVEVDINNQKPLDLDEVILKIQEELSSQQDVDLFNQKYSVNLVLPSEA